MEHSKKIQSLAGDKGNIKSLRPLFSYLKPYRLGLTGVIVALLVTSCSMLSIGKGLGFLIDSGLSQGNSTLLNQALFILLGIAALLAMGTYARYYLITYVGERVVADIRRDLYGHIIYLSPEFFESNKTGDILSRLTSDTELFQMVVGSSLSIALRNTVMFIGGITLLIFTSPKLAALVGVIIPVVVIPIVYLGRKVRRLSRASQDKIAALSASAEESLYGIKTIQSYAREPYEQSLFERRIQDAFSMSMQRVKMRALLTALVIFTIFAAIIAVLCIGGRDVLTGDMSAGDLTSFMFYAIIVATSTGAISEVVGDLQRAAGSAERIMELLQTQSAIQEPKHPNKLTSAVKGFIDFQNVTFFYPSRPELASLDDFSLSIKPGETVALVGPSGAGKSTIFQLLMRFYDPQNGMITLDGTPINTITLNELRSQFALVPQEPIIFSDTVMENIRFAKPEASEKEVISAAQAANAIEFIEQLPHKFDTYLGEKGVRISGGQKQRIAIARAILKDPAILLLDEATSALDSDNERKVQDALDRLSKERTTLIIAHRLSTIQNADRILVLHEGKLESIGSHAELMKQKGRYAELAKLQYQTGT